MIDWQRLEQEMAELHHSERIADRIVRAAHRQRIRRGVLLAAGAAVAAAAVAVPLLGGPADRSGPAQPASGAYPMAGASPGGSVPSGVQAAIYAAALSDAVPPVWVRSSICNEVPTSPATPRCRDAVIPRAVQHAVVGLLGRAVRFAADPPVPRTPRAGSVVGFGRLQVSGDSARLGMETVCGGLCGQGETLTLRLRDGRWQVSGSVGPRWVS